MLIHGAIEAFYCLFSEGDDASVEIGNAFVKSGWILALPRVFILWAPLFQIDGCRTSY